MMLLCEKKTKGDNSINILTRVTSTYIHITATISER